jgi:hypothetical protein
MKAKFVRALDRAKSTMPYHLAQFCASLGQATKVKQELVRALQVAGIKSASPGLWTGRAGR